MRQPDVQGLCRLHASCASSAGQGVLLTGPSGSGKSDLLLRLLDRGFDLVADDQVVVRDGRASAPADLAGLLEVRGLGVVRRQFVASAALVLAVALRRGERLPLPVRYDVVDLPMVAIDPFQASAPLLVELALRAVSGRELFVAGAFG